MMSLTCLSVVLLIQFIGFSKALFEECDHTYNLRPGSVEYLQSPSYPNKYPSGSSCRYKFVVPLEYEIYASCKIALDEGPKGCNTEYFYISQEGDSSLIETDEYCGFWGLIRISLFRTLVIAYVSGESTNSGAGGSFSCNLTTRPQECNCGWSAKIVDDGIRRIETIETVIGEFPSMAALYHAPSQTVFCSATIVSRRAVLTSIHCTRLHPNAADLKIIVGRHDLSKNDDWPNQDTYDISTYYESPFYDPTSNDSDIALLVTTNYIEWSHRVGPICLPLDQESNTFYYTDVKVVAWGQTRFGDPHLGTQRKASVSILPNFECQSMCPSSSRLPSQFCTFYPDRDAVVFDSGDPVVYKGDYNEFLLGITSSACYYNQGVNTRITSSLHWIHKQIPTGDILCYKPFY